MSDYAQKVKLGLGEAVQRLLAVEFMVRNSIEIPKELLEERALLLSALDHLRLEIDFDCDGGGIPDNVQIFKQAADTSCCRLNTFKPMSKPKKEDKKKGVETTPPGVGDKKKKFGLF